jgi:hypothetical protein
MIHDDPEVKLEMREWLARKRWGQYGQPVLLREVLLRMQGALEQPGGLVVTETEYIAILRETQTKLEQPGSVQREQTQFFDGFFGGLLHLVPRKHRQEAYEPAEEEARKDCLERLEKEGKDGKELRADPEYRREIRIAALWTFLTLPWFFFGPFWHRLRRMVSPR